MSRTIAEIYNALNTSKASMQELHDYVVSSDIPGTIQDDDRQLIIDVKSGSSVAIWRLWLWIMAVGSWVIETLFDKHKADIIALLASERPHTLGWYAEESKKYQYGYALEWIKGAYVYSVDDPTSRIIAYAAASEKNGKVYLKVAKEVNGIKVPLDVVEKTVFGEFWNKWRDAGVKLEIVSQAADILKFNCTIIRDRLVLDSANRLIRDHTVNPINNAITSFANSLEFDGILRLSKLVDALQSAEGVIDVKLTGAWCKPSGGSFTAVDMWVEPASGYFIMNYADSSFQMIDNVNVEII